MQKPNLYIIAGPNGVGKTTFAREFLLRSAKCRNFINDVRRRFNRSINNFFNVYEPLLDFLDLIDNSGSLPRTVAKKRVSGIEVMDKALFHKISILKCGT